MRWLSMVSIASRFGSSRESNRRENRLALAAVFMHHSPRAVPGGCNSKNALKKATETVCMTNGGKRVAWVTGGGSGIGEAGGEALAADGWTVVVSGRRKDALEAVVAKIVKNGGKAEAMALDVSVAGEVATPILKLRPVVPSDEEQAKMLQPEDLGRTIAFVANMPPRVCMNEILISPTHNRGFIQTPHSRD